MGVIASVGFMVACCIGTWNLGCALALRLDGPLYAGQNEMGSTLLKLVAASISSWLFATEQLPAVGWVLLVLVVLASSVKRLVDSQRRYTGVGQ